MKSVSWTAPRASGRRRDGVKRVQGDGHGIALGIYRRVAMHWSSEGRRRGWSEDEGKEKKLGGGGGDGGGDGPSDGGRLQNVTVSCKRQG